MILELNSLPILSLREEFNCYRQGSTLLIEAEPGAGKSTMVPLWVLEQLPKDKQVWLIQPRVLATLALAKRLTDLANAYFDTQEKLGQRVGYQVPFDSKQNATTQLLLMTPGILLQHLLHNPTLDRVACVILDEVHERSVNQDLAYVFLQEASVLREDLQLILMSATPDPALQKSISNRLYAEGRQYPVETRYLPGKKNLQQKHFDETISQHLLRALSGVEDWQSRCCLVFLPGWKEIEQCRIEIGSRFAQQKILCLHSRVSSHEQIKALDEREGPRLILSTNIAETSLTIPDVTLVIDSGLMRRVEYEQRTGISHLRTSMISQSSADQRRGRAGRVQAGLCIRLWSQDAVLSASDLPEIRSTDYLPLALRLAHWASPIEELPWIEKPNLLALDYARQELCKMEYLDSNNEITETGKKVSILGTSPRVAALLLRQDSVISDDLLLLALMLHFDLSSDAVSSDWKIIAANERTKNSQWQMLQNRWLNSLSLSISKQPINTLDIAKSFSDRIGVLLPSGKYRLNSAMSVSPVNQLDSSWAVFPLINAVGKESIALGFELQLDKSQQKELSQLQTKLVFKKVWTKHNSWWMGGVMIDESYRPIEFSEMGTSLSRHIQELCQQKGLIQLGWCDKSLKLLQCARMLKTQNLIDLPDISDQHLLDTLPIWLSPFLSCDSHPDRLPWLEALSFYLGQEKVIQIQELIPEKIVLPSGRSVEIQINSHNQLMVSAKLQEFFGCEKLNFGDGKLPLQIHLLSPNGSPVAITSDLRSFWRQSYPEVCKEMRGRYPRHPWPDDPMSHQATALTKRKLNMGQS